MTGQQPSKARPDRTFTHLVCGNAQCPQVLVPLSVPSADFLVFPSKAARRATVRFTRAWRPDGDGAWSLTPDARLRRLQTGQVDVPARERFPLPESTGLPFLANILALVPDVPRAATGEGAKTAELRRNPPLPARVRCPRCGRVSLIDRDLLEEIGQRAAAHFDKRRSESATRPRSVFDAGGSPPKKNRGKGHRRGGRGESRGVD